MTRTYHVQQLSERNGWRRACNNQSIPNDGLILFQMFARHPHCRRTVQASRDKIRKWVMNFPWNMQPSSRVFSFTLRCYVAMLEPARKLQCSTPDDDHSPPCHENPDCDSQIADDRRNSGPARPISLSHVSEGLNRRTAITEMTSYKVLPKTWLCLLMPSQPSTILDTPEFMGEVSGLAVLSDF